MNWSRVALASAALFSALASAAAPTMQAAVVTGTHIQLTTLPRPQPQAGELLIQVHDASVNPADWQLATQRVQHGQTGGSIPGFDGAGVVVATAPGVSGFKPGDAVLFWSARAGAYAQYIAVPRTAVALKPSNLSFPQAAGLAHAGLAAWNMLQRLAPVQAGQRVLVLGAAGGVGSASVQIAKMQGAKVIATTSAAHAAYVRELGADEVIDYQTQHFEAGPRDVDIAVNTVDMDNGFRALAVIRPGGHLVSVAGLPVASQCQQRQIACGAPSGPPPALQLALSQLSSWAAAGKLTVTIDRTFALAEVLRAWQYSQAGHTRGKSVIHIRD